jgi:hypothetical protein
MMAIGLFDFLAQRLLEAAVMLALRALGGPQDLPASNEDLAWY